MTKKQPTHLPTHTCITPTSTPTIPLSPLSDPTTSSLESVIDAPITPFVPYLPSIFTPPPRNLVLPTTSYHSNLPFPILNTSPLSILPQIPHEKKVTIPLSTSELIFQNPLPPLPVHSTIDLTLPSHPGSLLPRWKGLFCYFIYFLIIQVIQCTLVNTNTDKTKYRLKQTHLEFLHLKIIFKWPGFMRIRLSRTRAVPLMQTQPVQKISRPSNLFRKFPDQVRPGNANSTCSENFQTIKPVQKISRPGSTRL